MNNAVKGFIIAVAVLCAGQNLGASQKDDPSVGRIAECVSKDVWDAGFLLRFDLRSCHPGPMPSMHSDLYETVRMWTPERVYIGHLRLFQVDDEANHLKLVDKEENPNVEIDFRIANGQHQIELLKLNGNKPARYTTLECAPVLLDRLANGCR